MNKERDLLEEELEKVEEKIIQHGKKIDRLKVIHSFMSYIVALSGVAALIGILHNDKVFGNFINFIGLFSFDNAMTIVGIASVSAVLMLKFLGNSSSGKLYSPQDIWDKDFYFVNDKNEKKIFSSKTKNKINQADILPHIGIAESAIVQRRKTILDRISSEISSLEKRGALNLVLGIITASFGMIYLLQLKSPTDLIDFLPRLSTVLIVEVFSYFFLRLYKSTLAEIKYFQNESTNIEYNFVALELAIETKNEKLIEKCISKFLEIERNPLMKKGQTTREIINENISANLTPLSPDYLVKIIEAIKKNDEKPSEKQNKNLED